MPTIQGTIDTMTSGAKRQPRARRNSLIAAAVQAQAVLDEVYAARGGGSQPFLNRFVNGRRTKDDLVSVEDLRSRMEPDRFQCFAEIYDAIARDEWEATMHRQVIAGGASWNR
ncbi:hypothetical protein HDU84_008373 [Entophlyctis sp. JEL0112]|nr:hypothetical protein HDU84_008373 [Entophlyctis sp. JEL0112]